jgi:hypothetical protein
MDALEMDALEWRWLTSGVDRKKKETCRKKGARNPRKKREDTMKKVQSVDKTRVIGP